MFGANPIRKQELRNDGKLWIQEIFRTIQGEGPYAGRPAIFIRLAGCNLACKFCDTEFESGAWLDTEEAVLRAELLVPESWTRPLFVLTGGEPLRQDIRELVRRLLQVGDVQIETAGTLWLDNLPTGAALVVSPKTGSLHAAIYARVKHLKYILRHGETAEDDGLPTINPQTGRGQRLARPTSPAQTVWVQPCDDHDPERNRLNLETAKEVVLQFGYNLSMQQHKLLGLP